MAAARKGSSVRRAPRKKQLLAKDLHGKGARVVAVFGPFQAYTLVRMPTELALEVFPDGLPAAASMDPVEAVEHQISDAAESTSSTSVAAVAATALAMAHELVNPFNSATSKSMCAARLLDALEKLRELAPPGEEDDRLDRVVQGREDRRLKVVEGGRGRSRRRANA